MSADMQMSFEECARRILQRELQCPVVLHDDGRQPRMFDLRVGNVNAPHVAIECVAAVDAVRAETWNTGPAKGHLSAPLDRDWYVVLRPHARNSQVRKEIAELLRACEAAGITGYTPVDWTLNRRNAGIFGRLERLKIASISGFREGGTGKVYFSMTGVGGAVDTHGTAVARWIEDFLTASDRNDVLSKLERADAAHCHVFIGVAFAGVPWLVESYLGTTTDRLPPMSPRLPSPVDAVWVMYGKRGLHWDGLKWRFFDATVPAS